MSDPRWTGDSANADIRTAWQTVYGALNDAGLIHHSQIRAAVVDVVLTTLDNLGLLVQPGGETRTEYRYGGWYGLDEALAHTLHEEGKEVETRDIIEHPKPWRPWQPATQEAPHG